MVLLDTLRQRCNCMADIKDDEFEPTFSSFVRFLSNITCWDIDGGTILKEHRKQMIPLDMRLCDYNCIDFQPYFKNISLETVTVKIIQFSSEGVTVIPFDEENWYYDEYTDKFYVYVRNQLQLCECCEDDCTNNQLIIEYEAGFDLESPGWIDLLCHYFSAFVAINNNCMSIEECCQSTTPSIGYRLTQKKIDKISYSWELDTASEEYMFQNLMKNFYYNLLSKYALCGRIYDNKAKIWIGKDCL